MRLFTYGELTGPKREYSEKGQDGSLGWPPMYALNDININDYLTLKSSEDDK